MSAHQPSGPSSPPAVRLRRPGWRDTRFLVGLVLVALSVAMGSAAFSAAARTVPVFVAAEPLVPGEAVDVGAVVVRQVRLAESLDLSLIHISEPTRLGMISYAVFCLKKKK